MGHKKSDRREASDLTQEEADNLISMAKIPLDPDIPLEFFPGMDEEIDFRGEHNEKELFRVIVSRYEKNTRHCKYELLARHRVVLLRFEIEGSPHRNPDGVQVPCPHLHRYRAGFDDRCAEPIKDRFGNTKDLVDCLIGFLRYCQAVQWPPIQERERLF